MLLRGPKAIHYDYVHHEASTIRSKGRPTQAWNVLSERDDDRKLTALGLYWDKVAEAIFCITCKYDLQRRASRHWGDKHESHAQAEKGLSAFTKHLSLPDPNQLDPHPDHCLPHPHLSVHSGAALRHCNYRPTRVELYSGTCRGRIAARAIASAGSEIAWIPIYNHRVGRRMEPGIPDCSRLGELGRCNTGCGLLPASAATGRRNAR